MATGQKTCLIHQMTGEFLLANNIAVVDGWKHSIKPEEAELLMARICITYLMFPVFGKNSDRINLVDDSTQRDNTISLKPDVYSYLSNVASFWATHYRRAQWMSTNTLAVSLHRPIFGSPSAHSLGT
jgi:hypothetical protein